MASVTYRMTWNAAQAATFRMTWQASQAATFRMTWNASAVTFRMTWDASAGTIVLQPPLYVDPDAFYTHAISESPAGLLQPPLYVDPDIFYTQTVIVGQPPIAPPLYVDPDIFYPVELTSTYFLTPCALRRPGRLLSGSALRLISVVVESCLLSTPDVFYPSVLKPGTVTLLPTLYTDPDIFFHWQISVFYVDTEVICVGFENRSMRVPARYRLMIAPAEDKTMAALREDNEMDSYPRRRVC